MYNLPAYKLLKQMRCSQRNCPQKSHVSVKPNKRRRKCFQKIFGFIMGVSPVLWYTLEFVNNMNYFYFSNQNETP